MGPDESTPVRLFLTDPVTGEQTELSDKIVELSISETGDDADMSDFCGCRGCSHADENRKLDGKIRCKRWSRWVSPRGERCEEYSISFPFNIDPVQYAEREKYLQRKQGVNLA